MSYEMRTRDIPAFKDGIRVDISVKSMLEYLILPVSHARRKPFADSPFAPLQVDNATWPLETVSGTIDPADSSDSVPLGVLRVSLTDGIEQRTTSIDLMVGILARVRHHHNSKNLPPRLHQFSSNEQDDLEASHLRPCKQDHLRVGDH